MTKFFTEHKFNENRIESTIEMYTNETSMKQQIKSRTDEIGNELIHKCLIEFVGEISKSWLKYTQI